MTAMARQATLRLPAMATTTATAAVVDAAVAEAAARTLLACTIALAADTVQAQPSTVQAALEALTLQERWNTRAPIPARTASRGPAFPLHWPVESAFGIAPATVLCNEVTSSVMAILPAPLYNVPLLVRAQCAAGREGELFLSVCCFVLFIVLRSAE